MGKPTESAVLKSWKLTDSRLTAREFVWDKSRPSPCGQQLCNLVCLRGFYQGDQDLFMVNDPTFWNPFPLVGCFAQP